MENARRMRKNSSVAENLLWQNLRNRKLCNLKFRRQQPIEGFILDFYCDEIKLGIEVDGGIHSLREQAAYDATRTRYLMEFGIEIIRFRNEEVEENISRVLEKIKENVKMRKVSPSPRPAKQDAPLPVERGTASLQGANIHSHPRTERSLTSAPSAESAIPLPGERGMGEGDYAKLYRFKALLQREGWLSPAYVGVNRKGVITYLSDQPPTEPAAAEAVLGLALPGFQNAHSHAFQYGMTGLAEVHPVGTDDDFWTWREAMYQCALSVDPDQAEAIAAMLYVEMLRHGYTHVAEFHYLHHDKSGKPYAYLAEMGERMVAAAKTAGIKITLVPVFYQKGNFGTDPQPRQRRFISQSVAEYFRLLDASREVIKHYANANLAFSVHSLRAVELKDIVTTFGQGPKDLPFHLHVSEQKKEVADCLAYCGKRPMQWLLENLPVNERFHLVHSTHLNDHELQSLAASNANVVLCPSTEGNLGDGIFRMKEYVKKGGHWSIGTDSHIGLNPLEEFRMIDYRQRLLSNKRNTFDGDASQYLVNESVSRGRLAMGKITQQHFAIGQPFDAVVYNSELPRLATTSPEFWLPTLVYHHDSSSALGTIVNGAWAVRHQKHADYSAISSRFKKALGRSGKFFPLLASNLDSF